MPTLTTPENELEQQARDGDAAAFGALIRLHDDRLRAVVWAVVRSPEALDDVMQASYEKAFRSIGTFDGRSAFTTWLHSICYRTAIDHIRYEGRRTHEDVDSPVLESSVVSIRPEPTAEVAVDRAELGDVLDQLDPDARGLLMLVSGHGYSFDDVAAMTGLRRGTVASKVSRARKKLHRWETT